MSALVARLSDAGTERDLGDILHSGVATGAWLDVIGSVLESPQLIRQVATRSYYHANGFLKIVVAEAEGGARLRLHWWQRDDAGDAAIHDHAWDLASLILAGGFTAERYNMTRGAGSYQEREIGTLQSPGVRELGSASLKLYQRSELSAPGEHELDHRTPHRIVEVRTSTVTLVAQGRHRRPTSSIFLPDGVGPEIVPYSVRRPDAATVRRGLEVAQGALLAMGDRLRGRPAPGGGEPRHS